MAQKKRCFVVMGFGIKTDLATGRKLNLDNAYQNMIKPAVERVGLECVRADEIPHSGNIDVQMYRELLTADVVVADISTANPNAIYELGVRHALRPRTTIVISESELKYPFDLNHILITSYTHMGDDIGVSEARRFIELLGGNLNEILQKGEPDSPIYTYLADLTPPQLTEAERAAVATAERVFREAAGIAASVQPAEGEPTLSERVRLGEAAIRRSDFVAARALFAGALEHCEARDHRQGHAGRREPYLLQRLALTTYKARQPDPVTALREALEILQPLAPEDSNDPETVGIAGAIHKHLYEEGQGEDHLARAIRYYARGYFLRSDLYHGINLAAQLTLRAASPLDSSDQERISDLVFANRIREEVLELCERELARIEQRLATTSDHDTKEHQVRQDRDARYWCTASMAEAYFGLGRWEEYQQSWDEALALGPAQWMAASLEKHLGTVRRPLEAYGHLLNPPWQIPASAGGGKSPATAVSGA